KLVARINETFDIKLPLREFLSRPILAELATVLSDYERASNRPQLIPVSRELALPLSYAQQRLWLLDRIDGGSAHYNMSGALRLEGKLNVQALERAFFTVVQRHESLRTYFISMGEGDPRQEIQEDFTFHVPITDLSTFTAGEQQVKIAAVVSDEASRAFDLSRELMLRAQLLKLSSREQIVLVTMHHIASDGWSMGILVNEFSRLYSAYVQGEDNPLAPLTIQYGDYAHWQRNYLQGPRLDEQLAYWEDRLSGLPVVHNLPLDRPRAARQSFAGNVHTSGLDKASLRKFMKLCQDQGATLFMGLHAVFSVLLSRYSNENDIVIGTPVANREQLEVADLIGFFVNTLVLRCDTSGNPGFRELLAQSKQSLLDAYEHQQVPFELLVERLQPERNLSHMPLFQVMLALQNNDEGSLSLPGLTLSAMEDPSVGTAKFDLSLNVIESEQGLQLKWGFNVDLFDIETIQQMAEHFETLLLAMVQLPDKDVFAHELVTRQERHQILNTGNDYGSSVVPQLCIHELFEAQVASQPNKTALITQESSLSYGELNRRANQLAHYLKLQGVKPDSLVGLCVDRSMDMVIGILAILKAGGAYVPFDPDYPESRLLYMLKDSGVDIVLTQERILVSLPLFEANALCLDKESVKDELTKMPEGNQPVSSLGLTSSHLAYVIYTSGSTGQAKGVLIQHQGIVNLAAEIQRMEIVPEGACWGLNASYAFDSSVKGLSQLMSGVALRILPRYADQEPQTIREAFGQCGVIDCTPLMVEAWFDLGIESALPNLIIGGEAISLQLWAKLCDWQQQYQRKAVNVYGPTECSVNTHWTPISGDLPHIGYPLGNVRALILNENTLAPVGVPGELCIGGEGLARGYLNHEKLTAEKFVANPYFNEQDNNSCRRLYRTGDLVRRLADGCLEFIGRTDHQVKIRGFRIEPAEIEHVLADFSRVKEAVVIAREAGEKGKHLVGYLLADDNDSDESDLVEAVRLHIGKLLPEYMVPSAFVVLESFPLTANGKVDRNALPEPNNEVSDDDFMAPQTEEEKALSVIWQELLGLERIALTDNFFELGGHSLLATKLAARISESFDVQMKLRDIFKQPVLAAQAKFISAQKQGKNHPPLIQVSREQPLPLSFAQQRLWLLDQIDGGSAHYNMPAALKLTGTLNEDALQQAIVDILVRHESLRTCFVAGDDGEPLQLIRELDSFEVPLTDLSALSPQAQQTRIVETVSTEAGKLFDLARDLMLRAQLLKVSAKEHILLVTRHHIASDGWSLEILLNEFSRLYTAYVQGQSNPLPPLAIQYGDYAHWQRNYLQGAVLNEQLTYWEKQLADLPVLHSLPLDHPRPAVQSFAGNHHISRIEQGTHQRLMALCQTQGATLFMGLHAVFSVLLARYSNAQDIVVGTPVANREQAEVAGLIGFFVNTLVLRSDLSAKPDFLELLKQSKAMLLEAYARQQVPFEQIVERLQPDRSLSHSPLFQVMLVLQNNETGHLSMPGLELSEVHNLGPGIAQFDLTLNISEEVEGLVLDWEFNTDLFK
ncbi:amino acid adenylation domain-containing protein, partial [Pseudoalteromonas luteoviolacea]